MAYVIRDTQYGEHLTDDSGDDLTFETHEGAADFAAKRRDLLAGVEVEVVEDV